MKCPKCGADVKEGSKVCLNCGYYLNSEDNEDDTNQIFNDSLDEYVKEDDDGNEGGHDDVSNEHSDDSINNYDEIDDEQSTDLENSTDDFDDYQSNDTPKKEFDLKKYIIYIIFGFILVIAVIILIVGISSKNNKSTPTPTSTPEVKTTNSVTVDNYKLIVPAGLEYKVENNIVNITDDKAYSFSLKINDGNFNNYSSNIEELAESLNNSGYKVISSEKKIVNEKEFLIYTLSLGTDVSYLYITEFNSSKICMGVINVHNKSSVDSVCEVILKVFNTITSSDGSTSSDSAEDSSGVNNNTASLIDGIKSILN